MHYCTKLSKEFKFMINHYSTAEKKIIFLLILMQITQLLGCATVSTNQAQYAELYEDGYFTNGNQFEILNVLVDGNQSLDSKVVPGHHKITAKVVWSTEQKENLDLEGDFLAGKKYVLLGYELSKGQETAAAVVRPKNNTEQLGEAATGGLSEGLFKGIFPLIILTAPIWIPIALIINQFDSEATGKPFDGCCFIWIEELETRKIIAGNSPHNNLKDVQD
jgi:hypothetical protein